MYLILLTLLLEYRYTLFSFESMKVLFKYIEVIAEI